FSSRRRHTRCYRDWSSDVCSSDLFAAPGWRGLSGLRPVRCLAGEVRAGVQPDRAGIEVWRDDSVVRWRGRVAQRALWARRDAVRSEERRVGEECVSWGLWGGGEEE